MVVFLYMNIKVCLDIIHKHCLFGYSSSITKFLNALFIQKKNKKNWTHIQGQEPFLNMTLDISSSCSYIVGAVLWACASVLYVIDVPEDNVYVTAALTYVVGSGFFISGAANSLAVLHLRLKAVRRRLDEIRNFNVSQSALNADPHDY